MYHHVDMDVFMALRLDEIRPWPAADDGRYDATAKVTFYIDVQGTGDFSQIEE